MFKVTVKHDQDGVRLRNLDKRQLFHFVGQPGRVYMMLADGRYVSLKSGEVYSAGPSGETPVVPLDGELTCTPRGQKQSN